MAHDKQLLKVFAKKKKIKVNQLSEEISPHLSLLCVVAR
jgi:hypothetical protein